MIKKRTVINQCEIKLNGNIDVREAIEYYEDDVVETTKYHRYVVLSDDKTPASVQAFLDNSKA